MCVCLFPFTALSPMLHVTCCLTFLFQYEYFNAVLINERDKDGNFLELGKEFILAPNDHFNNLPVNISLSDVQVPTNMYNKGKTLLVPPVEGEGQGSGGFEYQWVLKNTVTWCACQASPVLPGESGLALFPAGVFIELPYMQTFTVKSWATSRRCSDTQGVTDTMTIKG